MSKPLEELLEKYYEERDAILFRIRFYKLQLEDTPSLKYIYSAWILEDEQKLKELDVDIQYLQFSLKSDNNV